jgi:CO/xanthine dehydrogenase FAD-binding subunit
VKKSEPVILKPNSLSDALNIYSNHPDAKPIAGGLSLFTSEEKSLPHKILDLTGIEELKKIKKREKNIDVGPLTTISKMLSIGPKVIPNVLYQALNQIGSSSLRNMITIGGNICSASPFSDALLALFVLDAVLELKTASKTRYVPVSLFIQDDGRTILKPGELLTTIRIDIMDWDIEIYKKVRRGTVLGSPVLSFCGAAKIIKSHIEDLSFAFGAVSSKIFRNKMLETLFIGRHVPFKIKEIEQMKKVLENHLQPLIQDEAEERYIKQAVLRMISLFFKSLSSNTFT